MTTLAILSLSQYSISPKQVIIWAVSLFFTIILLTFNQSVAETAPKPATVMIGQMVWVKGKVEATAEDKTKRSLNRRSPIYEKDTIETDKAGSGQIVFTDSSLVALRSGTVIKIEEYKFSPDKPEENKYVAGIAKGGFRTITGLISKARPDNYKVKTPVATIGVRGTDYTIFYSPAQGLAISLDVGSVVLNNQGGELILDRATNQLFGSIKDNVSAPKVEKEMPAVLASQPEIVPAKAPTPTSDDSSVTGKPPVGGGGSGGSGGSPKSGTPKVVSGFCISLLENLLMGNLI
jgi:hypothetical protein